MKRNFRRFAVLFCVSMLSASPMVVSATETEEYIGQEKIIGPDERVNVTNTTTNFFPTIVKIESKRYVKEKNVYYISHGTGVMVASDVVLTSGHLVYDGTSKTYRTNFKVTPATSNGSTPYGTSTAIQVKANPEYLTAPSFDTDYAVLKLAQPLGNSTGYLKLSRNINVGEFGQSAGYPGDRPGQMVYASGLVQAVTEKGLKYTIDTSGGQSGSPILNADNEIVGVHGGMSTATLNDGARTTQEMVNLINSMNPSSGQVSLSAPAVVTSKPVYRLYNKNSKRHHYTSDINEKNTLVTKHGWQDEGVAWETGDVAPVYRLYNPTTKDHLLTTDMSEVQQLQVSGWKNEGVAFQSGTGADVFRLYSPVTKEHFYTASVSEKDHLINVGWKYEGVAFKAN